MVDSVISLTKENDTLKKYTDEELSRILGEASCGALEDLGCSWGGDTLLRHPHCCINQAAYNITNPEIAAGMNHAAELFDMYHDWERVSPDTVLQRLEKWGAA